MLDAEKPATPYLVLVANDQEWEGRSLESILGPCGFAVVHAHSGRQTLELARRTQPDAVILDAGMPDLDGFEVCRRLRREMRASDSTPILVTTAGPAGRAQRLDAYRAGAWEFFGHPLDTDALLLRLATFARAKREADRFREASLLDQRTGLYNVRGLARRAQEIGADASRRRTPLACVAIAASPDLADVEAPSAAGAAVGSAIDAVDFLDVGDAPAVRIAEHCGAAFRRTARHSDVIGILGHGEFGVIAPETEARGAVRLLERLQRAIEAEPVPLEGERRPLRVRAGYHAVPDFATSPIDAVEMLMRAATALRHAKTRARAAPVIAFDEVPRQIHPSM